MLVLVPDTLKIATVDGFELVANARLNPEQVPEVDQLKVRGNVMEAPAEGLLSVVVQAAFALSAKPAASATQNANRTKKRTTELRCV